MELDESRPFLPNVDTQSLRGNGLVKDRTTFGLVTGSARTNARQQRFAIIQLLESDIREGRLAPGDQLPTERELAATFGATRTTVRKAMDTLEAKGTLIRRIGSGTFVAPNDTNLGVQEVPIVSPLDIIEARHALEPNYVGLAVARATSEDFALMQGHIDQMRSARNQDDFRRAGYRFHVQVAHATRNPLIVAMQETILLAREKAGWGTLTLLTETEELRAAQVAQLQTILDAIRERDRKRASALLDNMVSEMIRTIMTSPAHR